MRIPKNQSERYLPRQQQQLQQRSQRMSAARQSEGVSAPHHRGHLLRRVLRIVTFPYRVARKIPFIIGGVVIACIALFYFFFFTQAGSKLVFGLKGESEGRTNILVMGVGGEEHPGGDLADMITLVSIDHKAKRIGLLSFPRDIEVTTKYGITKINAVHAAAEHKDQNGPGAMKELVSNMTGQPIQYYVRLDFPGFVELVDSIGGVDVDVEKTYLDWMYPNPKYDGKFSFKQGIEHLDGQWALNYARSRKGDSGEGSDFRRAKRHQDILLGLKAKVLQDKTYLNPKKIMDIIGVLQQHISTDLTARDVTRLAQIYKSYNHDEFVTKVLDNSATGVLQAATSAGGSYVLRTKTGDFSQIQQIAASLFGEVSRAASAVQSTLQQSDQQRPQHTTEHATVEIQNATSIVGLATRKSKEIDSTQFDVVKVGNAKSTSFATNVIFDNIDGDKSDALARLAAQFHARVINDRVQGSTADFVLVIVKE